MNGKNLTDLKQTIILNFENRGYPELIAAGLNRQGLETLIQVWENRVGEFSKLIESLAYADYALENHLPGETGKPYTFKEIYSTLWRGQPFLIKKNYQPVPSKVIDRIFTQKPAKITKIATTETEIKLLDLITQLAMTPVSNEMLASSIGVDELDVIEILDRYHNLEYLEIFTQEGDKSGFFVIRLSEWIVFDGHDWVTVE